MPKGIVIGGGVLGGGIIIGVVSSGGGGSSTATTPTTTTTPGVQVTPPPPTTTTTTLPPAPPPSTNLSGTYTVSVRVAADPSGHDRFIGLGQVSQLQVSVDNGGINISGPGPWVEVSGSIDPSTGRFNARGRGTVAGNRNVNVRFDGRLNSGQLGGDYTMGTNGELPGGQSITYRVDGSRN